MEHIRLSTPADIPAMRELWALAFGDSGPYVDNFFHNYYRPERMIVLEENGLVRAMTAWFDTTFVLPGEEEARAAYLYAVATAKAHRGKGYAKKLLRRVAERGTPVFLRPMSPSLFDFYKSAGFTPFSPYREWEGAAEDGDLAGFAALSKEEYLAARDGFLQPPYCRMTADFLSLSFSLGGAVGLDGRFAALFERSGDTVLFKEWWGDATLAPQAAKFLGATDFVARTPDKNGTPFGVGIGIPAGTVFLAALD